MWAIFRKDLEHQKFVIAVFLAVVLISAIILPRIAIPPFVLTFIPAAIFLAVVIALPLSENAEDKNNGYQWLQILPIQTRNLIIIKFTGLLVLTAVLTAFTWLVCRIFFTEMVFSGWQPFLVIISASTLVVSSLAFSGIYILGMLLFSRILIVFGVLIQVFAVWVGFDRYRDGALITKILQGLTTLMTTSPWIIFGGALLIWVILIGLTTAIGRRTQV